MLLELWKVKVTQVQIVQLHSVWGKNGFREKRLRKLRIPRKASPSFGQYPEKRSRKEREKRNCAFLLLRNTNRAQLYITEALQATAREEFLGEPH